MTSTPDPLLDRDTGADIPSGPGGEAGASKAREVGQTAVGQGREVAATAAAKGQEVAHAATDGAREVAVQAQREAIDVVQTATAEARRLADQATGELRSHASAQTDRLGEGLRTLSGQLRSAGAGDPLPEGPVRDLAQQAAARTSALAERLASDGIDGVVRDLSGFARRRPGAFLAGAAVLGFMAGRMVRSAHAVQGDERSWTGTDGAAAVPATSSALSTDYQPGVAERTPSALPPASAMSAVGEGTR